MIDNHRDPQKVSPRKHLGQHFLKDQGVIHRIVHALGPLAQQTVIEIGPGQGALTFHIMQAAPLAYVGVEADARCVDFLQTTPWFQPQSAGHQNSKILHQDALTCAFHEWEGAKTIVSNLPYHISTQILCHVLPYMCAFDRCVFMFQREVADRITARPGTKAYGRLAVMAQSVAEIKVLCHVKPGAFFPPPKIDSTVLIFEPLKQPLIARPEDWFILERVVKQAFSQRRKQLKNTLSKEGTDQSIEAILRRLDIQPSQRPENLTVQQFVTLSQVLSVYF